MATTVVDVAYRDFAWGVRMWLHCWSSPEPPATMPARPRKRVRRRRVSGNFDDSSSSSSADSAQSNQSASKTTHAASKSSSEANERSSAQSDSESSASSSSSSSSSGSSATRPTAKRGRLAKKQNVQARAAQLPSAQEPQTIRRSPSPVARSPPAPLPSSFFDPDLGLPYLHSPPDFSLPPGLDVKPATLQVDGLQSARLKLAQDEERFRKWYMATMVDRFPNELDQLRASSTPKNNASVDLLVAALGAGVDIFDDRVALPSSSSSASSSHMPLLDDRHLVLETLDLLAKQNHRDPALCPANQSASQDVEMSNASDDS